MEKRKQITFALIGIALILISSCKKDPYETVPAPLDISLSVIESFSGSNGGSVEITVGSPLVFAWEARRGESDLQTFSITQTGANVADPVPLTNQGNAIPYTLSEDDQSVYADTVAFMDAGAHLGTTNYTFEIIDAGGSSATVSYDVNVLQVADSMVLSNPLPLTWTQIGENPADGLSQFGLKWTQNSSTSAIIALDGASKMVDLGSSAWANIVTHGNLNDAIAAGISITNYTGVSATESGTYDDVLGVTNGDVNYMIHITEGTVTTDNSTLTIVITGMYKN